MSEADRGDYVPPATLCPACEPQAVGDPLNEGRELVPCSAHRPDLAGTADGIAARLASDIPLFTSAESGPDNPAWCSLLHRARRRRRAR